MTAKTDELDEYVGCRITKLRGAIIFTQDVLLQSYEDEFDLPSRNYATPARPGNILTKGNIESALDSKMQTKYRSGVGKLIHMMQWSRPDIFSAVRNLTRHMQEAIPAHNREANTEGGIKIHLQYICNSRFSLCIVLLVMYTYVLWMLFFLSCGRYLLF